MGSEKMMTTKVKVGQIIKSKEFVNAYYKHKSITDNNGLSILIIDKTRIVVGKQDSVQWYRKCAQCCSGHKEILNTDATDPSRAYAEFKVVYAQMEGGSGPDARDYYPDGWHVKAICKERNEEIDFYQSGCFRPRIYEPVEVVGETWK